MWPLVVLRQRPESPAVENAFRPGEQVHKLSLSFIVESAVIIQERGSHFRLPSGRPHSHAHARRGRFESRRSSLAGEEQQIQKGYGQRT